MADTQVAYPFGIVGLDLTTVNRATPADQPPALPINEKLSVIGKPTRRIDGKLKVTGAARYSADVRLPGMVYAYMVCSPVPAGKIKSIDTKAAEKMPGVVGVYILEKGSVRYAGQPIAAVAAGNLHQAMDAARAVKLDIDERAFVVDMEKAKAPGSPQVTVSANDAKATAGGGGGAGGPHNGNVIGPNPKKRGDIDAGFKAAEVTIEAEYRTQVQTHCALETHGMIADWKPDGLTVYASTQGTNTVRDELADVMGVPKSQVRVITEFMGGGFGAKFGAGHYGAIAANLSKQIGKPVWLMLDRKQEHLCVGNRPNSAQKIKIGAKKDGTLTAIQSISYGSAGVGGGAGVTGPVHTLYPCPNIYTEDSDILINAGPGSAFRAPGFPPGVFGLEQAIDELAAKLQIDPLALRDKIDPDPARTLQRKLGAQKIAWANRKPANSDAGPIKRGIGLANSTWYRGYTRAADCQLRISRDGSVELMSSVQDIGGGARTALAQIVAEELGLQASDITMRIGDTNFPAGTPSGGSSTTSSMSPSVHTAAWRLRKSLLTQLAPSMGASSIDGMEMKDGKIFVKADPTKGISFKAACSRISGEQISATGERLEDFPAPEGAQGPARGPSGLGGVQFAQVAVDTETGVIKVEKIVAVHDCGRPLNPLALTSQINGGVIQGMSYALFEDRILDRQKGLMVNPNLEEYKIAGSREMPEIEVSIIEQYWAKNNIDCGGIGEPAIIPTAAAIANAVFNATGVRIRQIPMTPSIVLAALSAGGQTA
ncbi:MAG TPA: xanthine dehydrogenase family protein molybdopterin-binding subunit [Tepidisphaeraceae bacterium]|jgi:xanthine dehydrogenase YagR molybdenum-binding subunit